MIFDCISVGGGVVGLSSIINLLKEFADNKKIKSKKIYRFAIVDKDVNNIPGGVAYSFNKSMHGYFNNPLRLSPKEFIDFAVNNNNFKINLIKYLNKFGGRFDKIWIKKNKKILLSKNYEKLKEIYLPRFALAFWYNYEFKKYYQKVTKKNNLNIKIYFFEAEVSNIIKDNKYYKIESKNNFKSFSFDIDQELNIKFYKADNFYKNIITKNIIFSIGMLPPRIFGHKSLISSSKYIWDFYDQGSTKYMLNLLEKNNKKIINVYFIGFKAGLLEALTELSNFIKNSNKKITLYAISPTLESLQKAKLSDKKYKLSFFKKSKILKIYKSSDIYKGVLKEFELGNLKGFSKYDIWTEILKLNILDKLYKNLTLKEKKIYNNIHFNYIRKITRFTHPVPIEIKDKLIKNNELVLIKEDVSKVVEKKNSILIKTENNKYNADLVINVSGPLNIKNLNDENIFIKNLKNNKNIFSSSGFIVNKNFEVINLQNVYCPGVLASGYNPSRKVIVKALIENSKLVSKNIYSKLNSKTSKLEFSNQIKYYEETYIKQLKKYKISGGLTFKKGYFNESISDKLNKNKFNLKLVIDGKAGSGKSTIGRYIAVLFNSILIDTGYIFKAAAKIISKSNKKLNKNQIRNIFNNITLRDLSDNDLDNFKYSNIVKDLANNKQDRIIFNQTIKRITLGLRSFILTGRDTSLSVFANDNSINKIFLNTNDIVAAKRKEKNIINIKKSKTFIRNINDYKNIKKDPNAIEIKNNYNNAMLTSSMIIERLDF